MLPRLLLLISVSTLVGQSPAFGAEPVIVNLWPDQPPGETRSLPHEADQTKPEDRLIAGRRIIKLGNVSVPQLAVYKPSPEHDTGAAVIICPGGGHHILAYDLEGTEVAEWLNTLGVTGIVLKYRVPFRDPNARWKAAVQDAQRAVSVVRVHASEWKIDPQRIGICGFSAGGETAALAALLFEDRQYAAIDKLDEQSARPDFAMLIYTGGLLDTETNRLREHVVVPENAPPMFLVHAFDDRVSVQNTLLLASALKQANIPTELHIYHSGGHGYGLRKTDAAVTHWPDRAGAWLRERGFLETTKPETAK